MGKLPTRSIEEALRPYTQPKTINATINVDTRAFEEAITRVNRSLKKMQLLAKDYDDRAGVE